MNPSPPPAWRQRLYDAYVSSGQGSVGDEEALLSLRGRRPYIESVLRAHVPADKGIRVLDLGCGYGPFLLVLKDAGYRDLAGVDVSPEMVALAARFGLDQVRQGDLGPFLAGQADQSADAVLLMDVLEHMDRTELFATMDEVFRVLRPGGRAVIHVPNSEGIFGSRVRYGDLTHELAFNATSLRQLGLTVGFRSVRAFEEAPVAHGLKSRVRRILWKLGTVPFRLLYGAESGTFDCILSQNVLCVMEK